MPHHTTTALSGVIQHVFAHRFTVAANGETHLADLGPKGVEAFPLAAGLAVDIEGEQRPSEIKVTRISSSGRDSVLIEHKKPQHAPGHLHSDQPANLDHVLSAVTVAGWSVSGEPRRKPKHFEVPARLDGGALTELHVDFAGTIYKQKPADAAKWAARA